MNQETAKPAGPARMFGPEMRANPYPVYHLLRSMDPVHWHEPIHGWVLTRYADVAAAVAQPARLLGPRGGRARAGGG